MFNAQFARSSVSAVCIILLVTVQSSDCLRCYVCNSALHENCGTSAPHLEYLVECSDATAQPSRSKMTQRSDLEPHPESRRNYTFCRKNVVYIPKQDNKEFVREAETRVVRSCGWLEPESKNACKWGATDGVHREMCSCSKDECNSAMNLRIIGLEISILLIISGILI